MHLGTRDCSGKRMKMVEHALSIFPATLSVPAVFFALTLHRAVLMLQQLDDSVVSLLERRIGVASSL